MSQGANTRRELGVLLGGKREHGSIEEARARFDLLTQRPPTLWQRIKSWWRR